MKRPNNTSMYVFKKQARYKFASWKKSQEGREYLGVLFVESDGRCPKCLQHMVLSYEDKTYENRATFNHKIPISSAPELAIDDGNLEILCRACNQEDGIIYNHEKASIQKVIEKAK